MKNVELMQGLYGSQVSKSKVVAYCKYHQAALTVRTMRGHQCLKKQCDAFQRYEEHSFWKQREYQKEQRKAKKRVYTN